MILFATPTFYPRKVTLTEIACLKLGQIWASDPSFDSWPLENDRLLVTDRIDYVICDVINDAAAENFQTMRNFKQLTT